MDVEVTPFNPFSTAPRGPWCDMRTRFTHYGPVDCRPSLASDSTWSTPRSHRCSSGCFASDVDISSLTNLSGSVSIYVKLDQATPVAERILPPRPSTSQTQSTPRPLLDFRKGRSSSEPKRKFTFPTSDHETGTSFKFEASPPARPDVKRARAIADVDGPNTASLSCKKRRLRLDLITSRLSQPFSLPATHILNREAIASGDKRFLKMATHVEMVRRGWDLNHSASSFRRFALLNMTRASLKDCNWTQLGGYLSCPVPADKGRPTTPIPSNRVPSCLLLPSAKSLSRSPMSPPKLQNLPTPPSSRQAAKSVSSPPSPLGRRVESSEKVPERRSMYDEEDDCEAFPDSLYVSEDDSEDVYSDFGAIFDSGTSGPADDDSHSFEDYLDELDGISWAVR